MNRYILQMLLVGGLAAGAARAEFEMPKHAYRMDKLDQAKAEATAKGEPLAFIYTHEKTSCGLCRNASLNAADRLKSKTVVVYANSDQDGGALPPVVKEALATPEAGKYVPKTVLVDAKLEKVLAVIPYALGDEQNKLIKAALRGVEKSPDPTNTPPAAAPASAPLARDETRALRTWTSRSGATLQARLLEQAGAHLVLQTAEGKQMKIMPDQLCVADQQYVQAQRAP